MKNVPTNRKLWNEIKAKVKARYSVWPSAYASGALTKEYKERGGRFRSMARGGLTKWFDEKWVDISRPKPGGGRMGVPHPLRGQVELVDPGRHHGAGNPSPPETVEHQRRNPGLAEGLGPSRLQRPLDTAGAMHQHHGGMRAGPLRQGEHRRHRNRPTSTVAARDLQGGGWRTPRGAEGQGSQKPAKPDMAHRVSPSFLPGAVAGQGSARQPSARHFAQVPSASIVAPLTLNPTASAAWISACARWWSSSSVACPHVRQIRNCAAWVWSSGAWSSCATQPT